AAEGGAVRLTTVDADVLLRTESASGAPLDGAGALGAIGLASGDLLPDPSLDRSALESIDRELAAAEPGWVERIIATADGDEDAHERSDGPHRTITRALPDAADTDAVLAAVTLWARRVRAATSISVTDARARQRMDGLAHLVSPPFAAIGTDDATDLAAYARVVRRSADIALAAGPFLTDLVGRIPSVRGRSIDPDIAVRLDDDGPAPHAAAVTVAVGSRTWSVCARTDDVDRV
ncbi:MAG: hypothetical protein KDB37_04840, partial [Ilumatobacter sp.]|nr:hypothetical protein [Ilumatobacter sp.]